MQSLTFFIISSFSIFGPLISPANITLLVVSHGGFIFTNISNTRLANLESWKQVLTFTNNKCTTIGKAVP